MTKPFGFLSRPRSIPAFKRRSLHYIIFITYLIFTFNSQACQAEQKKQILVLHSYHHGLEWTDSITRGIQSVLSPFNKLYEVHYEYLDTKRNKEEGYIERLVQFITDKHQRRNYSAIIVADNNALEYVNSSRIVFSGNPPVIFCGINNFSETLINGISNVTGVAEVADHHATIDLIQRLHPTKRHIMIVIDQTPSGNAIREELRPIEKQYQGKLELEFMRNISLVETPGKLATLGDDYLIYLTTFNRDRNNNFVSYADGIEILNKYAKTPIYGAWEYYLGKGIVGGKIVSGYTQGREAAELALKILRGHHAKDLNLVKNGPTQYMFDYRYLQKYDINPSILPAGSKIINPPPSLYVRYKSLLIGLLVCSVSFVFILLWKINRQHYLLKINKLLAIQLEKQVHERTKELEISNRKLQYLSDLDGITQLYNRRYFDNKLDVEIRRNQRSSLPISLLICDIDYFKYYNDSYGHLAGDACIRSVADSIQKRCSRNSDIAARYGGEEFAIILPNTESGGAMSIAEGIRHDIEAKGIPHKSSLIKDIVSISIGVTTVIPDIHTTSATVISLADKALYRSKNNGRDRITLSGVSPVRSGTSKLCRKNSETIL